MDQEDSHTNMLWLHSKKVCILGLFLVVQCLGLPVGRDPNRGQVREKHGGEFPDIDFQEYMRYLEEMASNDPCKSHIP